MNYDEVCLWCFGLARFSIQVHLSWYTALHWDWRAYKYTHIYIYIRVLKCSKNTRTAHDIGIIYDNSHPQMTWGSGHANSRRYIGIIVLRLNDSWLKGEMTPMNNGLFTMIAHATFGKVDFTKICDHQPTWPFMLLPHTMEAEETLQLFLRYYWKCQQLALRRTSSPLRWVSASLPRLFQTFAKGFLTVPQVEMLEETSSGDKKWKLTRTIQKHSEAKVYQMDWHGTMAYLT